MATERAPRPDPASGIVYAIRIEGHLGHELADWFAGLTVTAEADGTTRLVGLVADQAALHGVLRKIRDLGLTLISIVKVQPGEPHPVRSITEDT